MYLFERPSNSNGIYAIFNLLRTKVYIGKSIELTARAKQHLEAFFKGQPIKTGKVRFEDNANILKEFNERKTGAADAGEFYHFTIPFDDNADKLFFNNERTEDNCTLEDYEAMFMHIAESQGFTLYNVSRPDPSNLIEGKRDQLTEAFCNAFENHVGLTVEKYKNADKKTVWENVKKCFLEKEDGLNYISLDDPNDTEDENREKIDKAIDVCRYFWFDKKLALDSMDIARETKSIYDIPLENGVILGKCGAHSGEAPYEILQKVSINLLNCGYSYWTLSQISSRAIMQHTANEQELYAVLVTTMSEIKQNEQNRTKQYEHFDPDIIENKSDALKNENSPEIMTAFLNHGKWQLIDRDHMYVKHSGKGRRSFIIEDIYYCKEKIDGSSFFDRFNYYFNSSPQTPSTNNPFNGQNSFAFAKLRDQLDLGCSDNADNYANALIIKLKRPFITTTAHIPELDALLSQSTTENSTLIFEGEFDRSISNKRLYNIFLFENGMATRFKCSEDAVYSDLAYETYSTNMLERSYFEKAIIQIINNDKNSVQNTFSYKNGELRVSDDCGTRIIQLDGDYLKKTFKTQISESISETLVCFGYIDRISQHYFFCCKPESPLYNNKYPVFLVE